MVSGPPPKHPLRRAVIILGALAPLVLFGLLVWQEQIPADLMARSIRLDGGWKALSIDGTVGVAPPVDESKSAPFQVPGNYSSQGFAGRDAWLLRHFDVPPALVQAPAFLLLSNLQSGTGEVFLNGNRLGETEPVARGYKTEVSGTDGIEIPGGLLHGGDNLLAIRAHWSFPGEDGLQSVPIIGPSPELKTLYEEVSERRRMVQYGAGSLVLFLIILFGALLAAEWETPNRPLYLSAQAILVASLFYLMMRTGFIVKVPIASQLSIPLIYLAVALTVLAQPEMIARYHLGPRSRFLRFHHYACGAIFAAFAVAAVSGSHSFATGVFTALCVYGCIPVTFLGGLLAMKLLDRSHEFDPIMTSGVLISVVSALVEVCYRLGLLRSYGVYPIGLSVGAFMTTSVLIADFTKVAFDNKALSASLKETNSDLAAALVRAQEAARLKSEFVANVSHELRTPLNSVLNIPEGLLEQFSTHARAHCRLCEKLFELDPGESLSAATHCPACGSPGSLEHIEAIEFSGDGKWAVRGLRQIHRAGSHLLNLINDVLDFSKLEAGRMVLTLESVNVPQAMRNILETLEPVAENRKVKLLLEVPAQGGTLRADSVKLSQIFINLVANAVKFSPEGGEVAIRAEWRPGSWRFSVKDHGIGIAREHHESVFESFRQVDGSNTRRFGGTGLGLAITKKLTEAHGGKVWVESELGKGSTFLVELPEAGPVQEEAPKSEAAKADLMVGEVPSSTILILDDERLAVDNLKMALRPLGHRIEGIRDPRELEAALAKTGADLLILDVMMPGLSGLDVLKTLKANGVKIPVLVSSAYHANVDIVRALGASWLAKPWRSAELQAEVTRLLRELYSNRSESRMRAKLG